MNEGQTPEIIHAQKVQLGKMDLLMELIILESESVNKCIYQLSRKEIKE